MYRARFAMVSLAAVAAIGLTLALSACGGSSSSSSTASNEETGAATTGGESNAEGSAADVEAAEEVVAPYIGKPSPFPVTEDLKEVPKGAEIIYVSAGTPIGELLGELMEGAAKTMGVKLTKLVGGSSANSISSAMDSVVAKKPAAVIVGAINIELWSKQLKELQAANIPVVTEGVIGTEPYGVVSPQIAETSSELEGELLAAYVVAEMGPKPNIAFYEVPELPFTKIIGESFTKELEATCPECQMRSVDIQAATLGNTAPTAIVSDLQANPETTVAVFAPNEIQNGVPQALQSAGITVKTLGYAPGPENLQYMKEGKETAGLAIDLPVVSWGAVDQAAREIVGQKLTGLEAEGISVHEFLTKKDITFDPAKGWTGYPDFAERFAKLWGVAG